MQLQSPAAVANSFIYVQIIVYIIVRTRACVSLYLSISQCAERHLTRFVGLWQLLLDTIKYLELPVRTA